MGDNLVLFCCVGNDFFQPDAAREQNPSKLQRGLDVASALGVGLLCAFSDSDSYREGFNLDDGLGTDGLDAAYAQQHGVRSRWRTTALWREEAIRSGGSSSEANAPPLRANLDTGNLLLVR